jgi:hypothetical protein
LAADLAVHWSSSMVAVHSAVTAPLATHGFHPRGTTSGQGPWPVAERNFRLQVQRRSSKRTFHISSYCTFWGSVTASLRQSVGFDPFGCSPVMRKLHAFNAGPVLGTRTQVAKKSLTIKPLPLQSSVEPQGLGHAAHLIKQCAQRLTLPSLTPARPHSRQQQAGGVRGG